MISCSHWGMFEQREEMIQLVPWSDWRVPASDLHLYASKHEWKTDYYDSKYLHG